MRTRTISIEDSIYIERTYSLSDALRLSNDAIYQDLENTIMSDIEVLNFRAIPVSIEEDFVTYKIYPTEFISRVTENDPVKIHVTEISKIELKIQHEINLVWGGENKIIKIKKNNDVSYYVLYHRVNKNEYNIHLVNTQLGVLYNGRYFQNAKEKALSKFEEL